MANGNAPLGLLPARHANGSSWAGECRPYFVPATDATALYIGDPVILAGSSDSKGVPTATRATAGATNRITGTVVGFVPSSTIVANGFRAASTAEYILVADGEELLYEVQEDAVGGALPLTAVGLTADLIAGSPSGRRSGWQLDSSTAGTGATLQVRIVEFVQREDNEPGNANAKVLVRLNLPTEAGIASGVGI